MLLWQVPADVRAVAARSTFCSAAGNCGLLSLCGTSLQQTRLTTHRRHWHLTRCLHSSALRRHPWPPAWRTDSLQRVSFAGRLLSNRLLATSINTAGTCVQQAFKAKGPEACSRCCRTPLGHRTIEATTIHVRTRTGEVQANAGLLLQHTRSVQWHDWPPARSMQQTMRKNTNLAMSRQQSISQTMTTAQGHCGENPPALAGRSSVCTPQNTAT
jgi:hypothetical protein